MAANKAQQDSAGKGKTLSWRTHPAAERPGQGILLIGIIIFCTWLFWDTFGQFYGIFCLIVLVISMAPFFLPTRYELDDEGIEITSLFLVRHFRPWGDYRSFYSDKIGAQLSPFAKPSRLAVFRGNFIRFGRENREEVIVFLNEHIRRTRGREEAADEA
jgi:hypothetical protein